jgi:23S rRNA U2552 (ribose-2'-O)-methylase RlmE/FtsJ
MGGSHQEIMLDLRKRFKKVINFKPKSSRKESREIFFICLNKI